jgi:hypothetical protein
MAYVGNQPSKGQWRKLSDLSGSFNGVTTTFTTSVPPGTSEYYVTAGSASQLLISLGGVIQQPDTDYTVSTNSITFTTAPAAGLSFFGVLCGDALNTGTPSDGSVTTAKLAGSLSVGLTGGSASTPSLYFTGDANTGIYSPGADQVAISTGGTGRLFVNASGNVGLGTSTPGSILTAKGPIASTSDWGNLGITSEFAINSANRIYNGLYFLDSGTSGSAGIGFSYDGTGYKLHIGTASSISSGISTALTVDRSQRVGIGNNFPWQLLHVGSSDGAIRVGASASGLDITHSNSGFTVAEIKQLYATTNDAAQLKIISGFTTFHTGTSNSERARLDAAGRLLVGTTTADTSGNALLQVNGSIKGTITSGTAVASTSGTAIDFTGIPSWVKRVTVMFNQVSLSGTSNIQIQLGTSGGVETSGYAGVSQYFGSGAASSAPTAGAQLLLAVPAAANTMAGQVIITNITGNAWAIWGMVGASNAYSGMTICNKSLSGTLDRVRITTVNGTDTFDAGSINILYEG